MSNHTVIWSAATCDSPGAGVYVGVAPQHEHMIVARALSRRQAKLFIAGRVQVPGESRPWQVYYYAVRDPSAVRVVPVQHARTPGGFRAAELRFRFAPTADETVAMARAARSGNPQEESSAVFLVTIGLNAGEDRAFLQRTLGEETREWSDVFARIRKHACPDAA